MSKILKAGGIILSNDNKDNIVLLYRKQQNDWSFPKGHIDPGENATRAMIREIQEETGLNVRIVKELPDHFYKSANEGEIVTKMFLVISIDDSELKEEHEGDKLEWVSLDGVVKKLSYNNLKDYFNLILPSLENN
jgi:8-oxo-dGTP diphosphatase